MPPKSEKKTKPVKDGPKKNKSSYMFFCEQERKKIKEDKPKTDGGYSRGNQRSW